MTYKNSLKLLITNFKLMWKVLVYLLLSSVVILSLAYFSLQSVFLRLIDSGILDLFFESYSVFMTNLNLTVFLQSVGDLVIRLTDWFMLILPEVWVNILLFVLVMVILKEFLYNLVYLPISNTVNYYMGSMTKYPFINSMISTAKVNLKFQLVNLFTLYPVKLLTGFMILHMFRWLTILGVFPILTLFLVVLVFTLLTVIRVCLFNVWIPSIVVFNSGVFGGLIKGVKITLRKFLSTFNNSIALVLTILVLNVMVGLATFGVGLLITVPVSYILYSIFGLVTLYDSQGMRYYVDNYNVIVPKKKDSTDKVKNLKYII